MSTLFKEEPFDENETSKAVDEIVKIIESVLPKRRPIGHHEPFIDKKKATVELAKCVSLGAEKYHEIESFESWLKTFTGSKHVLATNTGTSALHVALAAAGVRHGDEVIVPTTTFVATANAVSHAGATPHFIDCGSHIDPIHLKLYLDKLGEKRKKITTIIVVHLLGFPADIENICRISEEYGLKVIEDASQALGTRINGRHVGTFGCVGTFSFNNNKILTTNGGGAVITDNESLYFDAKQLASTARKPHKWLVEHESMAWNYRMSNVCAALGVAQAKEFRKTLIIKRDLSLRYRKALKGLVEFVEPCLPCEPNYWLNAILVQNLDERDQLLKTLHNKGIHARASFTPLSTFDFYKYSMGAKYTYQYNVQEAHIPKALEFFGRCVCLPSGAGA